MPSYKKSGSVTIEPVWIPIVIPNFRKIAQANLEKNNLFKIGSANFENVGTKIRKRVPHDMKPLLAKNTHYWRGF